MSSRRVAAITGGAGAIGRASAIQLAGMGYDIALLDVDEARAEEVANEIRGHGVDAVGVAVNLRDGAAITQAFTAVSDRLGPVAALVTSAGGSARSRIHALRHQDPEVIDELLEVNLRSVISCCQAVIEPMIEAGTGRIVTIGSVIGVQGKANLVEYAAAKGGVLALTKSLAMELGQHGITVNCVSPGLIPRSPVNPQAPVKNYVGRHGTPNDIAHAVAFLASDRSDFITGTNIVVDGGRSLGLKGD
ncbi:SDR family oxidoreductase [Ruania alkalisoli]|uniref:SDR family oxidoreductase n=1 Tax=Ruania alkalisoli TaxID=2779775 RepID=A0A7M1SX64_9MICO|nr:SDR family NAD(P)-dependent oxidoreductase [Ruania alkalisoli]QOR71627.1 SDR family oxidoreductase [Ruania alkalisoli]